MYIELNERDLFLKKVNIGNEVRSELKSGVLDNGNQGVKQIFDLITKSLEKGYRAVLVKLETDEEEIFSFDEIQTLSRLVAPLFGELLAQNEEGAQVIEVFDRSRQASMHKGARYHQTREGGSIHTDNVNIPEPWDYLFLSCLNPALVGGENILVDGLRVQSCLKNSFPEALEILEDTFIWEMRGVSDSLYEAPIITYTKDEKPLFRHLRPYMESAYEKANCPLTPEQLYALDVLDALTNSSENQIRYRMCKGDILFTIDSQVLHGRTCFSDSMEAVSLDEYKSGKGKNLKRTMERLWIRK